MIRKSLIFTGVLFASISLVEVASAQTSPFEGFYVGGQAGYSSVDLDGLETLDGVGGGGFIGYSSSFGGSMGGLLGAIEAEGGYDGASSSVTTPAIPPFIPAGTVEFDFTTTYGISGLIGYVIDDSYLIYGRVGWVRSTFETTVNIPGFITTSLEDDGDGFRIGGGAEMFVAENISARAEYTYTAYNVEGGGSIDQHLVRVGAAYHF